MKKRTVLDDPRINEREREREKGCVVEGGLFNRGHLVIRNGIVLNVVHFNS